jgi:hypothetical protein
VTTSSGVDPAAGFGVWSLDDTPMRAPSWVRAFTRVGRELAGTGMAAVGSASRLVVLSVPTGQYAAWAIAAGAFGAPPRLVSPVEPGVYRCATWVEESRQVADADVVVSEEGLGVEYRVGTTRYLEGWPVVVLPVGMPDSRLQRTSLTRAERDRIRAAVGGGLQEAIKNYNAAARSYNRMLYPQTAKMRDLGAKTTKQPTEIPQVDHEVEQARQD